LVKQPERPEATLVAKAVAEFLGTFFITIVATGVDVLYFTGAHVDYVSRWLARGFITSAMIYTFGQVSGAHIDPAVSLGFALRKAMTWRQMLVYWIAQFAGGFTAAGLAWTLWKHLVVLGASHPGPRFTQFEAVITEVVLTFLLMLVILATAEEKATVGAQAALAVGLTVAACGFFAGPISGASMNPARSLPPQIVGGAFGIMWIYVVGPFVGAALAAAGSLICFPRIDRGVREAGKGA
jgi:aquaporin Z